MTITSHSSYLKRKEAQCWSGGLREEPTVLWAAFSVKGMTTVVAKLVFQP